MDKKTKVFYKEIYSTAYKYLKEIAGNAGLSDDQLVQYKKPDHMLAMFKVWGLNADMMKDTRFIMCRLAASLQNRQSMPHTINFKDNFKKISSCVYGFDPKKINDKYGDDVESLMDQFRNKAIENIRERPQENDVEGLASYHKSYWYMFSKGILRGAKYLCGFNSGEGFFEYLDKLREMYKWCNEKYSDSIVGERIHDFAWKQLFDKETGIFGMGPALAPDFLKEIGYTELGKPDTHIVGIFEKLDICDTSSKSEIQKTLRAIASANEVDSYEVDKVFWLICSDKKKKFYVHEDIGVKGAKKNKPELLKRLKKVIN